MISPCRTGQCGGCTKETHFVCTDRRERTNRGRKITGLIKRTIGRETPCTVTEAEAVFSNEMCLVGEVNVVPQVLHETVELQRLDHDFVGAVIVEGLNILR